MRRLRKTLNGLILVKGRFVNHDAASGFSLAQKVSAWLYPPYRFSEFGQVWLTDEGFTTFLHENVELVRLRGADRLFFLRSLLGMVECLPGDIAECGSYDGTSALLLCRGTETENRQIHIFDSFEGLSRPTAKDGTAWKAGDLKAPREKLEMRLADYLNRVAIHPGWIPDRFDEIGERMFAFVHIDVDLYEPTRDSLEFFYSRMVPGGVVLFDDYGLASCPGQKSAVDEFFSSRTEQVVHVPTGQGFVVKQ